jgi:hypothetical protein
MKIWMEGVGKVGRLPAGARAVGEESGSAPGYGAWNQKEMGRKKSEGMSEVKVASGAKGKGGAGGNVKEAVKGGKKEPASVKGGTPGGGQGGVLSEGVEGEKKVVWRMRRGGVPVSSSWSSRQWATVGMLSLVNLEKQWVSMRDLRKWWKTYAPGEWRSEYGVLRKELDGLSKLKFVRLSRGGGRVRGTKQFLRLLYGSGESE